VTGALQVQVPAGRLDLLLSDPETLTRYEVEIRLGATDEAHIIRTIARSRPGGCGCAWPRSPTRRPHTA